MGRERASEIRGSSEAAAQKTNPPAGFGAAGGGSSTGPYPATAPGELKIRQPRGAFPAVFFGGHTPCGKCLSTSPG
jgi:hypothetical protein